MTNIGKLYLFALSLFLTACGPDPGNGSPCDGSEDCLPGLSCVPGVWQCLHPCEECDKASCITAADDPGFFCPAPLPDAPAT